jgi:hypothetical protein
MRAAAVALVLCVALTAATALGAADDCQGSRWVGSWGAVPG